MIVEDSSIDSLSKNWNHWPLSSIPLDKKVIAIWKSSDGKWKSGKFDGYEFYGRRSYEPFNDISVRWIYADSKDELANE